MEDTLPNIGSLGKKFYKETGFVVSFLGAWKKKIWKYITSKNMRNLRALEQKNSTG